MLATVAATLAYGESEAVPDEREDNTLVILVAVTGSSTPVVAAAVVMAMASPLVVMRTISS